MILRQVLDERSKQYSFAGDDSVSQTVTDLVRGCLCPAIKQASVTQSLCNQLRNIRYSRYDE